MSDGAPAKQSDVERMGILPESPWDRPKVGVFTGIFMFFIVIWIYVIPGLLAYKDNVLSQEGVSSKLTGDAAQKWTEYTQHKKDYQKRIEEIDSRLDTVEKTNADLSALLSLRVRYKSELEAKPPFAVAGMVGDWLNEIWALSYLALGCLVAWWFYPRVRLNIRKILGWTFILYIFSCIQVIARNGLLNTLGFGRMAYWWVNWDMSLGLICAPGHPRVRDVLFNVYILGSRSAKA